MERGVLQEGGGGWRRGVELCLCIWGAPIFLKAELRGLGQSLIQTFLWVDIGDANDWGSKAGRD